ncbi:hypothetical protein LWI29_001833 [Acer saccharum]|uniref:Uncharacterized protein n=1 Tax=Acer saccharum TaxID=4024 RepID=A0AA39TM26_ACESA|nr:hypothetical protein LWI29_001833 [Acer saccharum]
MAAPDLESPWLSLSSTDESFRESFNIRMEKGNTADIFPVLEVPTSSLSYKYCSVVPKESKDTWDKLFKEAHGADVYIITEDLSCIPAHSIFLSIALPALGNILQQSKVKDGIRYIKFPGYLVKLSMYSSVFYIHPAMKRKI